MPKNVMQSFKHGSHFSCPYAANSREIMFRPELVVMNANRAGGNAKSKVTIAKLSPVSPERALDPSRGRCPRDETTDGEGDSCGRFVTGVCSHSVAS